MKKILLISTVLLLVAFYSCDEPYFSIVGTKWQSVDKKMTFKFETDSTCTMNYYINPDNLNDYQSVNYIYSFEDPIIVLLTASVSGFGSYEGIIDGNLMKIKLMNSNFDYIDFNKTK